MKRGKNINWRGEEDNFEIALATKTLTRITVAIYE
jgi:hypothetical protein